MDSVDLGSDVVDPLAGGADVDAGGVPVWCLDLLLVSDVDFAVLRSRPALSGSFVDLVSAPDGFGGARLLASFRFPSDRFSSQDEAVGVVGGFVSAFNRVSKGSRVSGILTAFYVSPGVSFDASSLTNVLSFLSGVDPFKPKPVKNPAKKPAKKSVRPAKGSGSSGLSQ